MLSTTYSARISPEPRARFCVFGVALGCCVAALISIASLPAPWPWRAALACAWLLGSVVGLRRYQYAVRSALEYDIRSDGGVRVLAAAGRSFEAQLTAGTTVTAGFAWLRFASPGRLSWGEFVLRPSAADKRLKNKDWRRLQVICRHLPAC